jgi:hypothetical protein
MAVYDDTQDDYDTEEEDDASVDPYIEVEGVAMSGTDTITQKRISKRTADYTTKEDVFLCRSWLAISQDSTYGAKQKGEAYWKRVTADFHERRKLKPFKIHSDCG